MGRPKKPTDDHRKYRVVYWCNAKEYEHLLDRADQAKKPVNYYARHASLHSKMTIVQEQKLDFEARQKLLILNNNMNQIAHSLNATGQHIPEDLTKALAKLNEFWDEALPK